MGKVIRVLVNKFINDGYICACAGWHHNKAPFIPSLKYAVYHVERNYLAGEQFLQVVEEFSPDLIFCLGDYFYFSELVKVKVFYPGIKIVGYLNIDSEPINLAYLDVLNNVFDKIIATSNWGKEVISKLPISNKDIDVVYHGVDLLLYKYRQTKRDLFLVFINSKNSFRKCILLSIDAFLSFSKDKEDAKMLILTNPKDPDGWDLVTYLADKDFKSKITIKGVTSYSGIPEVDLVDLYHKSTVLLLCSMGEGFGLPLLEAMATGVVPVATDCSSMTELLGNGKRGILVEHNSYIHSTNFSKLVIPSVTKIVQKLNFLYSDWKYDNCKRISKYQEEGRQFAEQNTWDHCYSKIKKIVEETLTKERKSVFYSLEPLATNLSAAVNFIRNEHKGKLLIGVCKLGGYGDTLQLLPVLKGIKRKYPDCILVGIVQKGRNILSNFVDYVFEIGRVHYDTVVKSVISIFDIYYDIRYISKVYGEEENEFFKRYQNFYHGWAYSNCKIHELGEHVVNLMLKSTGLDKYASIEDMKVEPIFSENVHKLNLQSKKYITIHNDAGDLGLTKRLPGNEIEELVRYLKSFGYYVVQLGIPKDDEIKGVDSDLRNYNLSELETAAVLKNARLHIGLEGFLYHLAHSVGTKSAVWCTSTPPICFTYPGDIVFCDNKCIPCWWHFFGNLTWGSNCYLGEKRCLNLPSLDYMKRELQKELEG